MTYFAKLDADNVVVFVTAGRQEDDGLAVTDETF